MKLHRAYARNSFSPFYFSRQRLSVNAGGFLRREIKYFLMTADKKKSLLIFLEGEIQKARANAEKADEASKFIMTGYSQAGDKYHAEKAADLTGEYLKRLEKLKKEIKEAAETPKDTAEPVASIEVEYEDKSRLQFTLVKNAVSLANNLFISTDSPLGKSILGKKVGETFTYKPENAEGEAFSGKLISVQ